MVEKKIDKSPPNITGQVKGSYTQVIKSRFIGADDLTKDVILTIIGATREMVTGANNISKEMICLHFHECDKLLVVNKTNGRNIGILCASPSVENWNGFKIKLRRILRPAYGKKNHPVIWVVLE